MRELDLLAKRYGTMPSEFLKCSAGDFQFNLLIASQGIEAENKASKKASSRGLGNGKRS